MGWCLSVHNACGIACDCVTRVWSAVFVARPTERASAAPELFKVGPGARSEPTRARPFQKYLGSRRHSPKKKRLRNQAINLEPGGRPPETRAISRAEAHPTRSIQLATWPAEVRPNNWRAAPNTGIWPAPFNSLRNIQGRYEALRFCGRGGRERSYFYYMF